MKLVLANSNKELQAAITDAYTRTFMKPKYMFVHNRLAPNFSFGDDFRWGEAWAVLDDSQPTFDKQSIGYVEICIEPKTSTWTINLAINFTDDVATMGRALSILLGMAFYRNFHKLRWYCIVENPIFPKYKRICKKLGGKIEGTFEDDSVTWDGEYHASAAFGVITSQTNYITKARFFKTYLKATEEGII